MKRHLLAFFIALLLALVVYSIQTLLPKYIPVNGPEPATERRDK